VPSGSSTVQRVKEQQAKHWDSVAAGWDGWLEWTERNFSSLSEWFTEAAGWAPGVRALDIACGAGYPALTGARRIQPDGRQVATDISPAMVAVVSRRASAVGLNNIECLEMDAENLRFDDQSFDAVTNAYGLMFCPDPTRAMTEAYRVLKGGGRFAFATWDDSSKSPFFDVITSIAAPILSLPAPDPAAPGPFRLASALRLDSMLRASGFSRVEVESRTATFECASVAEYCQLFSDVAWKARIAALTDAQLARFHDAVRHAAQPFMVNGRLRMIATSLCASGQKA
jgi:enediyne biosynthesis protein CalE5